MLCDKKEIELEAKSNVEKYSNMNPIARMLLDRFLRNIVQLIKSLEPGEILDVGCGEGYMTKYMVNSGIEKSIIGLDFSSIAVRMAKNQNPDSDFIEGSIYNLPFRSDSFDLVVNTEVLEHLERPEDALVELRRVSKKHCIISVPNEPFFRFCTLLRGRDITRLGKTPRHIHTWSKNAFVDLVKKYFRIVKVKTSFPWVIVLAEKPG